MATTLDTYMPFDAGAGANVTEDQWRQMARQWRDTGVLRNEDDEMEVFGDSTGMQVKVRTGQAWIEGHYGANASQKTLLIAAADATNPRIDRVVLRANLVNNRLELDILTGTPAATPSAPALTQSSATWEISLAQVSVPATDTSIAANQVTDERPWAVAFHGNVLAYTRFRAGSDTTINTSSTTLVDADATNLAIRFVVPPSGRVLIRLEGHAAAVSQVQRWALREGSSTIASSEGNTHGPDGFAHRTAWSTIIEGLTPGQSKTWKWAHGTGAPGGTSSIFHGQFHGALVMTAERID